MDLPAGTVTFLFTDVERSTRLLSEIGAEAFRDALAEHQRTVRKSFARYGGVEVDTQGDSFFVAFARAADAVGAAADAQQALHDGLVSVRMGIHTGEPLIADGGYVGIDVHRAARIAAAGSGEQILLSRTTRELIDVEVTDLGDHRLKDLSAPERIYQLGRREFPRLKTLHQTNLPVLTTPLVGREQELRDVVSLLHGSTRLLTLTGAGGSGKTRLALHAAAELADGFPDGVWFVSLAPLSDPTLVLPSITRVLEADGDLQLHLRDKQLLLLVDNFEQVLGAASDLAEAVGHAAGVRMIVTSRERLHLSAEREYQVPVLATADAATLFVERAQRFDASVERSNEVEQLVAALDCLPLAIELAAARIKVLSPGEMRDRLGRRLDLLTGGDVDTPQRQRTLRDTIEWSYELLEPSAQEAFGALSAFPATFSADAAERVAGADIDLLGSLVDKSLLRRTADGRFFMLATIREYALVRLDAAGDGERAREAHASHYASFAEDHRAELYAEDAEVLDHMELEHDNLRAALSWLRTTGDHERELTLAAALGPLWNAHGHLVEGRRNLEHAVAHGKGEAPRAYAQRFLAVFAHQQGDLDAAAAAAAESVALYEQLGETPGLAGAVLASGNIAMSRGDLVASRDYYTLAQTLFGRLGDPRGVAVVAGNLAYLALHDADERALELAEAALSAARKTKAATPEAIALLNVALAHIQRGNAHEAAAAARAAVPIARSVGQRVMLSYCVEAVGAAAALRGDGKTAARLLAAAEAARTAVGAVLEPLEARVHEEAREKAQASVSQERFKAAWDAGSAMLLDDAVTAALDVEPTELSPADSLSQSKRSVP